MPNDPRQDPRRRTQQIAAARGVQADERAVPLGVPALARHADPLLARPGPKRAGRPEPASGKAGGRLGGVEWVRALDLATGKAAGLGSRFGVRQESAVRRLRAAANPVSRRGAARRSAAAAVLPPASAFGATPPPERARSGGAVAR
ncbi:MAG: hypothetical protein LBC97_11785 [Bifidobacteriaceae bacterium]|jgi:hypothetical protein|nr:hypothetical protein [Bifidobacteriaceae bacterium]